MIIDNLGKGAFAKVKLAYVPESEEFFAIKVFRISTLKRKKDYFKKEGGGMLMRSQYD